MEKILILFSGGADSVLMAEMARDFGFKRHLFFIDYGQAHLRQEIRAAKNYAKTHLLSHERISFFKITMPCVSALLNPSLKKRYPNVNPFHVPGRNLILVAYAASFAESTGEFDSIWFGGDKSDAENNFPDCRPEWVGEVNDVLKLNGSDPFLTIKAPLLHCTKDTILKNLKERKIPTNCFFSGYGAETTEKILRV